MDKLEGRNLLFPEELQRLSGQFFITLQQYLSCRRIERIGGGDPADDIFFVYKYPGDPGIDHLLHKGFGDLSPLLGNHLARLRLDILRGLFPDERIVDGHVELAFFYQHRFDIIEVIQDELRGASHRLEQDRHRHLPSPIDPDIEEVLGIELKIEP